LIQHSKSVQKKDA